MKDNYSRQFSAQCGTCGGSEFEFDDDGGPIRCTSCDRIYASSDELIGENGGRIERQIQDMGSDIIKDVEKDFSKLFKKFK